MNIKLAALYALLVAANPAVATSDKLVHSVYSIAVSAFSSRIRGIPKPTFPAGLVRSIFTLTSSAKLISPLINYFEILQFRYILFLRLDF